jgi:hypothetical protein
MTSRADRTEALIKQRIEQNQSERNDIPKLAGLRFVPLQLPGVSASLGRDYQRQQWQLAELLEYYDRQFVQKAYLVLLKRDVDVEGLTGRLPLLRSGTMSRLELLFRLRFGPEGKVHKTSVRGLLPAFLLERVCRIPIVGLLPRYLRALFYLPRLQEDIEQLRGQIAMQKNDSDDKDRSIVDFQNEKFEKLIRHLHR